MEWIYFLFLIITHTAAYFIGRSDAPEPFKPTNEAWVAVQCHAIDKQYEYARWSSEREQTEDAAASGDQ